MAKVMTIRPPETLRLWLQREAKRRGVTLNSLTLQILWEWVKENQEGA